MWKRGERLRKIRVFGCEKWWGKNLERIGLCGKLRLSTEGAVGNVLIQGKTSLLGVDVDGDVLDGLGEARVVLELLFTDIGTMIRVVFHLQIKLIPLPFLGSGKFFC